MVNKNPLRVSEAPAERVRLLQVVFAVNAGILGAPLLITILSVDAGTTLPHQFVPVDHEVLVTPLQTPIIGVMNEVGELTVFAKTQLLFEVIITLTESAELSVESI